MTTLIAIAITAVLANTTLRNRTAHLAMAGLTALYTWLLATAFGDSTLSILHSASIESTDSAAYEDGVYELLCNGYTEIKWLSGVQVRNLLAFGQRLAYTSYSASYAAA